MPSSGPNSPSSVVNVAAGSGNAWTNPSNAATENGATADVATYPDERATDYLKATGFGFSIPSDATIVGIVVGVKLNAYFDEELGGLRLTFAKLVKAGTAGGTNIATGEPGVQPLQYQNYGGASNLWGNTLTPSDINNSGFGVQVGWGNGADFEVDMQIDHIRITVYYTLPPVEVTLGAASAVASVVAPTIQLSSMSLILGAASAVGSKGDPSIRTDFEIQGGAASAVGSIVNPGVQLGSVGVTPAASGAVAGRTNPSIQLSSLSITLGSAAAVAAVTAPTVHYGSVTVSPPAASARGATKDPTLSSLTWKNYWVNRGPGFKVGDLLISQRKDFTASGEPFSVYQLKGRVTGIGVTPAGEEYALIYVSEGYEYIQDYETEIEWVVIGNTIDASRSNLIYMTADEDFSPRMEMRSGVSSHALFGSMASLRVALGNLGGIVDDVFGALSGYGLYSDKVYLKGNMILGPLSSISFAQVTDGPPAGATIGADWGSNVTGRPTNLVALGDVPGYIQSTYIDSTEIKAPNITGNSILGGNIVASSGGSNTAGLTGEESGDTAVRLWAGETYANRATAPFRVTQAGLLTAVSGSIAGWELSSTALSKTAGGNTVTISTGSTAIAAGPTGAPTFTLTQAGVIAATSGNIAGWELSATALSKTASGNTVTISTGATAIAAGPTGAPTFTLTQAGALTAAGVTLTGAFKTGATGAPHAELYPGSGGYPHLTLYGDSGVYKANFYINSGKAAISGADGVEIWGGSYPSFKLLEVLFTGLKFDSNTVWHAGNDGDGSGLDADLLDGNHASAFATQQWVTDNFVHK